MRTLHQAPLLSRRQEARGDKSQNGTMNTPCRRQPAAGGRGRHRIGGTPGGVAGSGKEDSFQHATNESSLDIPSMSREYKSWPALGDMDYAVHTIFVVGYGLCHFVQSTAPPHGLRVQKAGLPARSGRGAKAQASPPMLSGCWSVWREESMWGGGPNVQGPSRSGGNQNPSRVEK